MRILNFGSLNIDHVYQVDHIARPGETVASLDYSLFAGGKGANQSVAIARAGGAVMHIGKIGHDGLWMTQNMKKDGVDTSRIILADQPTGHAIIQVDRKGQNSIVICGGTNRLITTEEIDAVLDDASAGDMVLLQNEINNIPYIMEQAAARKLPVFFNPAPMTAEVFEYPLATVSTFIINQSEGEALTEQPDADAIMYAMDRRYPDALAVLTMGGKGCIYRKGKEKGSIAGKKVDVVDTTGAGDTFIGYLMAGIQRGDVLKSALETATRAAAFCVTRKGATSSIPYAKEIQ
jgi:ribokinase